MNDDDIRMHLNEALTGLAQHDHHIKTGLALDVFRAVVGLLAFVREPNVGQFLLTVGDQDVTIRKVEEKVRYEEKHRLISLLSHAANQAFNRQEPEYPSNTLDVVATNLRLGIEDNLTVPPDYMKRQGYKAPPGSPVDKSEELKP